jgi:hypothetical protein
MIELREGFVEALEKTGGIGPAAKLQIGKDTLRQAGLAAAGTMTFSALSKILNRNKEEESVGSALKKGVKDGVGDTGASGLATGLVSAGAGYMGARKRYAGLGGSLRKLKDSVGFAARHGRIVKGVAKARNAAKSIGQTLVYGKAAKGD